MVTSTVNPASRSRAASGLITACTVTPFSLSALRNRVTVPGVPATSTRIDGAMSAWSSVGTSMITCCTLPVPG